MLDLTLEFKATDKEKVAAQEAYDNLTRSGYMGTYAGGSRSKGQGFWVRKNGVSYGYLSCRSIRKLLSND